MTHKKVSNNVLLGEKGINLIQKRVLEMGFVWHQRGVVDAGVDGTIELRKEDSEEVLNTIIQVQSRATGGKFTAETQAGFEYMCDERDLEYWMRGNTPIILVRSRPSSDEAYWISVKDYFSSPALRRSRRILFDKKTNRFDRSCRSQLFDLGVARGAGLYLGPTPRREEIYSNLLRVSSVAKTLYVADTEFRNRHALRELLPVHGSGASQEWILTSKRLISFHDLGEPPWDKVCDLGTLESFDTSEWASSSDPVRRREFVDLLNRCLRQKAWLRGVRYHEGRECYYFPATKSMKPRRIRYEGLSRASTRTVFSGYFSKTAEGKIAYYRHFAFNGHFRRYADEWFLEIVPTYHYTSDGSRMDRWYSERLSGIKRLERNPAVLHQVLFWAEYLRQPKVGDLFQKDYPFLRFDALVTFQVGVGIPDDEWLPNEEDEATKQAVEVVDEPSLFTR